MRLVRIRCSALASPQGEAACKHVVRVRSPRHLRELDPAGHALSGARSRALRALRSAVTQALRSCGSSDCAKRRTTHSAITLCAWGAFHG
eukprot:3318719-Alexandrium_andersonii.AAC.1